VQWVRSDHERPDGRGYPDGALLIGIADAYNAITTDRNHRRGRPPRDALAEIRARAGTQFDPRLVKAL
jgi:HD-GYP domain-containing protein (c-di-GMP phosphodiesterase class II)